MGNSGRTGSKTCAASEKNQKETFNYAGKISIYKRSELRLNQKIRKRQDKISLLSLTKIAIALDLADELRNIFTQVPYKDIQEVINETR